MSHSAPGPRDPQIEALQAGQLVAVQFTDSVLRGVLEAAAGASLTLPDGDDRRYVRYADGTNAPGVIRVLPTVTEPTLLADVDEETYHGGGVITPGPQVSQSGLKMLRPPSTPLEFQHYLRNGIAVTDAMRWGSAVHTCVLGRGADYVRHPDELLTSAGGMNVTKESKAWIAEQKAAGLIVLKGDRYDSIRGAQDAILAHPVAGELFTDPQGQPEVSAYHEAVPGLWMRSRFDLLHGSLVDLKTAADPHPEAWSRQAWAMGYHIQDVAYRRAFVACTGSPDPGPMVFVVVGSRAPHLISVVTLDAEFERAANAQLDAALALYAEQYAKHGDPRDPAVRWDGLPVDRLILTPPAYATRDLTAAAAVDVLDDLERILNS